MTITNHILAGAIIGLAVKNPAVALPIAFVSHFAMDALPHFGYKGNQGFSEALRHKLTYQVGVATLVTSLLVVALLVAGQQWLALVAALIAALPDVVGVYNYRRYERHGRKAHGFVKVFHVEFHRAIQRYERPWGVYVEAVAFAVLLTILLKLIK